MKSVYSAVRTGALNKTVCVSSVKGEFNHSQRISYIILAFEVLSIDVGRLFVWCYLEILLGGAVRKIPEEFVIEIRCWRPTEHKVSS